MPHWKDDEDQIGGLSNDIGRDGRERLERGLSATQTMKNLKAALKAAQEAEAHAQAEAEKGKKGK